MAREHENFRPMLEQLNSAYPEKEFLRRDEVAKFCGCCTKTVDRKFGGDMSSIGISKVVLAKRLCTLERG